MNEPILSIDQRLGQLEQTLATVLQRLEKEEAKPSFWEGLNERIRDNPKIMMFLTLLLTAVSTWAGTYFSKPETRDVPGPERVIVKEGPTIIREVPFTPGVVKTEPKKE